jgi:F-type H+-transporting ATPase subunit epsilon
VSHTLELEVAAPGKLLVHSKVEEIQISGKSGYLGILPGHTPLLTKLGIGEISYSEMDARTLSQLHGGLPKFCRTA